MDKSDFILKDSKMAILIIVRNFGAFFDESMSMNDRVNRLVRSCFFSTALNKVNPSVTINFYSDSTGQFFCYINS